MTEYVDLNKQLIPEKKELYQAQTAQTNILSLTTYSNSELYKNESDEVKQLIMKRARKLLNLEI